MLPERRNKVNGKSYVSNTLTVHPLMYNKTLFIKGSGRRALELAIAEGVGGIMATMSVDTKKKVQIFQKVPELGLLIVFVGTLILFSTFNEYFASVASLKILLVTVVYTGIVLIGQALLMIVGELDLSVGAIASLGTITTGLMLADWNLPLPVAVLLGVGIGTFVGFLNGFITVKIGIPAFITTLAMLFLARGISYVLSGGDPVYPLPQNAGDLSRPMILGFPSVVWIFLILFMCADQFVRRSVLGRKFYLIGGNQVAARLSGIKLKLDFSCYAADFQHSLESCS